ncbi:MAG: phosphopentomutase [Lachnospiraceae bacterium]|nr:phosphopentomutase [Lachnospiraceae bacterium]
MSKRVILIVLDSVGCGEMPDAAEYGDEGSNTLLAASKSPFFKMENMRKLGYFNIEGIDIGEKPADPEGAFARLSELSKGKDTTTGHWEMAGVISTSPMPTYPNGFPKEVIEEFEKKTGRKAICNLPYSGTQVIEDYGKQHMETGDLIVYTSADSVFQIAAHEDIVPVETLYEYCRIAREMLQGEHGVGRVIARPFIGEPGSFKRTERRHDFSLEPTGRTMLDILKDEGYDVLSVGKIIDIFAERGITDYIRTSGNPDGIEKTIEWMDRDFNGIMFVNLVDTDMIYGHRNDVDGYAKALTYFDEQLPRILEKMREDDVLMITADHGCDPSTPSTDHSREYVPLVITGEPVKYGTDYKTLNGFDHISSSILSYLGTKENTDESKILSFYN